MSSLQGQRILVTGATGFIGRALCPALSAAGGLVEALSRSGEVPPGATRGWACDVTDRAQVGRVIREIEPDLVYHLASHVTGARESKWVLPTLESKLMGSLHLLLETESRPQCRIVLAGSLEEPDLTAGVVAGSPYAAATQATALYAQMFHELYGRPLVTARIFMAYGPGDPNHERLVPYVIRSLLANEAPDLSSGVRPVDWIYIADLVDGLVRLGEERSITGGQLDFGSGQLTTVRDVVSKIADQIGARAAPRFGALEDRPNERVRQADVAATLDRLGWSASTGLDDGLAQTIEAYRRSPESRDAR